MEDHELLLGQLKEFMDYSKREDERNHREHQDMLVEIRLLQAFRWKLVGGSLVLSGLVSLLVAFISGHR